MSVPVVIPRLGMTVTEVTLLSWTVPSGTYVAQGDPIATVETDKVETDLEAPAAGLLEPSGQPGAIYPLGAVIGEIRAPEVS
jgi:pyruvate/2-oxoglutarate dehydrogenase complex dihydrolipoamide acyltransferase (E2) component